MEEKQRQFNAAMELYSTRSGYKRFGVLVSFANVSLQAWLVWCTMSLPIGIAGELTALLVAWLLADFVNGLVHLYMDHNDHYDSFCGPLIANFHLHHKLPRYGQKSLPVVYFIESGSKVWLVPCLALLAVAAEFFGLHPVLFHTLVYAGILSSVAEVSHYLCHNSISPAVVFLGNCRILLSKRHHAIHHMQDNVNYAFLNGVTDPVINLIAARFPRGYKQNTDLHYATYSGETGSHQ
ncbi:fatty acid desaturase family protein [Geomonas azotofigens]|uniref:fatty acid desaturase family protein n=1 Tax=Geomonas azotofigens TaxID=2843196 RepID=UPI001C0FA783|nr:fatty acid desaturase family protein [Geomonas azotofigens]MBU5614704.1 fatty acid desaturase family protein [Geomonas azotofigens]